MKYQTATFDYANPVRRRICVPLDSDCGIAVKTTLNGKETYSGIRIDGQVTTLLDNNWAGYVFRTGSQPESREFKVEASFTSTQPASVVPVNWREELPGLPTEYDKDIHWEDLGLDPDTPILAKGTQLVAYWDGVPHVMDNDHFYVYDGEYKQTLVGDKWISEEGVESDYIQAWSPTAEFHIHDVISTVHEVRLAGTVQLGKLMSLSKDFYVDVTSQDKGYFDYHG